MKKIIGVLALTLSTALVTGHAYADTLTLVSTSGTAVGGEMIFPYNFSIDGSSATTPLICIDFDRHITLNETWAATKSSIPTDASVASTQLRALAIIASSLFNAPSASSAGDYQYAAWSIYALPSVSSNAGYTSGAQSIRATALAEAADPSFLFPYSDFYLYTPDNAPANMATWTDGTPQRFLGYAPAVAPEPSSLMLLGTGLLGVTGALRRKVSGKK